MSTQPVTFDENSFTPLGAAPATTAPATPAPSAQSQGDNALTFDENSYKPLGETSEPALPKAPPQLQPYDEAKHGKFTTPENYQNWATYPPGAGGNPAREWKPGEADAWADAHNLSLKDAAKGEALSMAAGAATGATLAYGIPAAGQALYELAVKHLAGDVLPELITNSGREGAELSYDAAHARLLELAPKVWQAAKILGSIGGGGIGTAALWKYALGKK
jgi:hypothetical protein